MDIYSSFKDWSLLKIVFKTKYGVSYSADSYKLIKSSKFLKKYKGKINGPY